MNTALYADHRDVAGDAACQVVAGAGGDESGVHCSLIGETGTGKDLAAKAVHYDSDR